VHGCQVQGAGLPQAGGGHGERRRHHPPPGGGAALAHNASAVLLAHNHVSGLALPSNADLLTTETLARVLREVGVELADHLIFTEDDMVSLKDSGC
jgi:DNA repair protein RadC